MKREQPRVVQGSDRQVHGRGWIGSGYRIRDSGRRACGDFANAIRLARCRHVAIDRSIAVDERLAVNLARLGLGRDS